VGAFDLRCQSERPSNLLIRRFVYQAENFKIEKYLPDVSLYLQRNAALLSVDKKNLTRWVSDLTMTNCSLKASCVATDISLSQYHLCYLCPRHAEEGNPLSDDEDYPFSYVLCVIGALVLFVLGAIGVLYFVFSR
jgi:hypothetical protein